MSTETIVSMSVILCIVWGGFLSTVVYAWIKHGRNMKRDKTGKQEEVN